MRTNLSPQTGPATALAELITGYDLPAAHWMITRSGSLTGSIDDDHTDMRPIAAAYAEVIDGAPFEIRYDRASDGATMSSTTLSTEWREVPIVVRFVCLAATIDEPAHCECDPCCPGGDPGCHAPGCPRVAAPLPDRATAPAPAGSFLAFMTATGCAV